MKLKNIISILLLSSVNLLLSCNDEFMERYPKDRVADENFWKSEEDIRVYLNTLYPKYIIGHQSGWATSYAPATNVYGSPLIFGDIFSDNAVKNGASEDTRLANGKYVIPSDSGTGGWNFTDLRAINFFLTRYQRADLPKEVLAMYAGEAYFFKAWEYFNKVRLFGDVPWLTEDLKVDAPELQSKRTPRAEVMDSVLLCIDKAVRSLPEKGKEVAGRLNKDQANFLKARICLYEGTYRKYHKNLGLQATANKYFQECITACNALLGKYSLYSSGKNPYYAMFTFTDNSTNPEVILWRKYKEGEVGHATQRYYSSNSSTRNAMGATRGLVDEYLCADGKPIYTGGTEGSYVINPLFLGYDGRWTELENRDPRLTQTICRPGELATIYGSGVIDMSANGIAFPNLTYNNGNSTVTGYRVIKHWMGSKAEEDRITNGIQAAIEFRYAEVLLNYAEAKYELEGILSDADIDLTINALRKRAGFDFTKYPDAKLTNSNIPVDPRLDKIYKDKLDYEVSPLLREIRRERRIEFAMENRRYDDMMRWKAGNLFTVPLRGTKFNALKQTLYNGVAKTEVINGETIALKAAKTVLSTNVWVDSEGFLIAYPRSAHSNNGILTWSDHRYHFPIPTEDRTMNPNWAQTIGWEAYE